MMALLEMPVDEQLRNAIKESGLSANELWRRTGVHQTIISRFLAGSDIRLSAVVKLAEHFNLGLLPMPPEEEKPSKRKPAK